MLDFFFKIRGKLFQLLMPQWVYLKEIFWLITTYKKHLFFLLGSFLLISAMDILGIGMVGPLIGFVTSQNDTSILENSIFSWFLNKNKAVIAFCFFLIALFFLKTVISLWLNYLVISFSEKQKSALQVRLLNAYFNMPYVEISKRSSSDLIFTVNQLTTQFSSNVLLPLMRAISEGLIATALLIFLAYVNFYAFLILITLLGGLVFFYESLLGDKLKRYGELANKSSELVIRLIGESFRGFKEIKIYSCEEFFAKEVDVESKRFASLTTKSQAIASSPRYLVEFVLIFFVLILISTSMANPVGLIQTLGIFTLAALRLVPSMYWIFNSLMQLKFHRNAVNKIYRDCNINLSKKISQNLIKEKQFEKIELIDVSFKYPGTENYVLKNINLTIERGDKICIVGPSGHGKTTLLNILLGLLEPTSGRIRFNESGTEAEKSNWKAFIGYMPQSNFLFEGSLVSNITLKSSVEDLEDERINNAVISSQVNNFFSGFEDNLSYFIGENGSNLSGGQGQRVCLARTFYFDRDVIFMDESTNSLDELLEKEILEEIKLITKNKTLVMITHDADAINFCNKYIYVKNGSVSVEVV